MTPTAGCGHCPVGSGSRERGSRYVFPYAPPERESVVCFPPVAHASVEMDLRQEPEYDDEQGVTCTQGVTPLYGIDDEAALGARNTHFTTSLVNKASMVRREAVKSRTAGDAVCTATARPRDFV